MQTSQQQPRSLVFLFLTELWERFGFYTIQGLLILYLTEYFGFSDNAGYSIFGVFSGLVYISPFVGGFLADKLLGFKSAIIWGGFFIIAGYVLLSLPYTKLLFYPALATIIVGNAFFKPSISSLLGTQYATDDTRRDAGFTIFYIGINIGALLAGLSSGYIKEWFGWRICFVLASVGMVISMIIFSYGLRHLKNAEKSRASHLQQLQLFLCCLLAIVALNFLLKLAILASWLLPMTGLLMLMFLVILTLRVNRVYRKRLILLNTLIISSIVFWTLFLQLFFAANLFIDRLVDKHLFGIPLTTTIFWGSESIFIVLLGPLFAWLWQTLGRKHKNPSPVSKFALGLFICGLGFVILATSTLFPDQHGLIPCYWIFLSYLMIVIGELLISPIGLSAVTMLAPAHLIGMMMGVWFVAVGFGGIFAGITAKVASIPDNVTSTTAKLAIYQNAFLDYAYLAFLVAIGLFFVSIAFKKSFKK